MIGEGGGTGKPYTYNNVWNTYNAESAGDVDACTSLRSVRSASCTMRSHVMALSTSSNAPSVRASTRRVSRRRIVRTSSSSVCSMSVSASETMDDPAEMEGEGEQSSELSESLPDRARVMGKGTGSESWKAEGMGDVRADMKGSSSWSCDCASCELSSMARRC